MVHLMSLYMMIRLLIVEIKFGVYLCLIIKLKKSLFKNISTNT